MDATIGLRERRRRATLSEIENAALDLFERQGFENTTVEHIAAAAGVSTSTFFRYFPTKEDAALGTNQAFETALASRLEGCASTSAPLREVERVVVEVLQELEADRADVIERMLRVRRLAGADAALRGAAQRREAEQCDRFVQMMAATAEAAVIDLRVRVLAETVSAALRASFDAWAADSRSDLAQTFQAACAHLRELTAE
ncbi:TetR family transcriptional regulator [Nocardiopsis sp. NPDC006198]|uniref:TetR family transcriptional regulator n=1 Tax=Nocardiopsis sp. NPDC006198 TaxID=3154472 RepID=UPI0033A41113